MTYKEKDRGESKLPLSRLWKKKLSSWILLHNDGTRQGHILIRAISSFAHRIQRSSFTEHETWMTYSKRGFTNFHLHCGRIAFGYGLRTTFRCDALICHRPCSQLTHVTKKFRANGLCRAKDLARTSILWSFREARVGVLVMAVFLAVVALAFPFFSWGLPEPSSNPGKFQTSLSLSFFFFF